MLQPSEDQRKAITVLFGMANPASIEFKSYLHDCLDASKNTILDGPVEQRDEWIGYAKAIRTLIQIIG